MRKRPLEPDAIPLDAEPQNRDWLRQLAALRGDEPSLKQILDALKRRQGKQTKEQERDS